MKRKLVIRAVTIAGLLLITAASLVAGTPIRLTFRDTTIASGTALSYPIYVDSSLSGYSVKSYQIEFTYNTSYFKFVGATSPGTIASAWGAPAFFEVSPGRVRVSSAGADTLAGTGKLVVLQFTSYLFTGYYSAGPAFFFQAGPNTVLNEGSPTIDFRNGTATLTPGPSITISPNTALLTKGDVVHFSASGGHAPYAWTSTVPSVASIDSIGNLTGLSAGFTKVVAVDSNGYVDTSGVVEVRAFRLSLRDTTRYQGQSLNLPVYCTDLTGLNIKSGQLTVTYNSNLWTPDTILTTGTLLDSYGSSSFLIGSGNISVSFAGTSAISGSGILFYVRMKASSSNSGGSTFGFQNVVFNQTLVANSGTAYIYVQPLATVNVTPYGAQTLVVGDSIQYSASGGTPPYLWSVSGRGQATISQSGWLKASRSGVDTIRAKDVLGSIGTSSPVSIYDFRLSVPDTTPIPTSFVEVPLYVSANDTGFTSIQLGLTYTTSTFVQFDSIVTAGTLSNGMTPAVSFHNGSATIAFAGTSKIFNAGILMKLRFAVPDSAPRPSTTYVNITSALFNEGVPLALIKNGSFQIANRAIFSILPGSAALHTTVGQKDSATFAVYNTGTANLTSSISVVGPSVFTTSTSSINVLPADSTKVTVNFQPVSAGPASATVQFNTNDPYHSTVNIPVTGVTPYPILAFNVTSVNFDTVTVGQFRDSTITITNTGTDTLKITNIVGSISVFTAHPTSAVIPPGQFIVDTVRFTPSITGGVSGRVSVMSNSLTSPDTVGVYGTGHAPNRIHFPNLPLGVRAVNFGSVNVGSFKDTAFTFTYNGSDTLKILGITTSDVVFSARPTILTILPGQSASDTIRFAPTLTGGYSGMVFIASNASSSPDTIIVSGSGTPPTDVKNPSLIPDSYSLGQNFPNPFNPSTMIRYGLRSRSTVRLVVFNILGQMVDELVSGEQEKGFYSVTWYPSVPSGVYFYRIDAHSVVNQNERFLQIRKMVLMK